MPCFSHTSFGKPLSILDKWAIENKLRNKHVPDTTSSMTSYHEMDDYYKRELQAMKLCMEIEKAQLAAEAERMLNGGNDMVNQSANDPYSNVETYPSSSKIDEVCKDAKSNGGWNDNIAPMDNTRIAPSYLGRGGSLGVARIPQGYRLVQFGIAPAGNSSPFAIEGHAKENLYIGNGVPLPIMDIVAGWTKRYFFKPQTNWRNTCEGDTGVYNWNYRERPGLGVTKILPWSGDTIISPIYDGVTPPYWIKPPSSSDYDKYLDY